MSPELSALLLVLGGGVAGFVNTVAGAGSALTIPLLLLAGLDATVANGTNRLGVLSQTGVATASFHRRGVRPWPALPRALPAIALGAVAGAVIATRLPPVAMQRVFGAVFLILAVLMAVRPGWLAPRPVEGSDAARPGPAGHGALFAVGVYGGLVQAGVGIPLLLAVVHALRLDLVRATAAKVALVLAYTVLTLAVFGGSDQIAWAEGAWLAAGSLAGGLLGTRATVRRGAPFIRRVVQITLVAAAVHALWR